MLSLPVELGHAKGQGRITAHAKSQIIMQTTEAIVAEPPPPNYSHSWSSLTPFLPGVSLNLCHLFHYLYTV